MGGSGPKTQGLLGYGEEACAVCLFTGFDAAYAGHSQSMPSGGEAGGRGGSRILVASGSAPASTGLCVLGKSNRGLRTAAEDVTVACLHLGLEGPYGWELMSGCRRGAGTVASGLDLGGQFAQAAPLAWNFSSGTLPS